MRNRKGFTLVELMIVIVILALLVGILMPAIKGAVNSANDATVSAEINSNLHMGLRNFHEKYGVYPPSRIVFSEDGDFSDLRLKDPVKIALRSRSLEYLRRMFPRVVIRTDGGKPAIPNGWFDLNGNHSKDDPYIVQGHECLALFLGGISLKSEGDTYSLTGFGKNPFNPFTSAAQPPTVGLWPYEGSRTVPFAEFLAGRVVGKENPTFDDTGMVAYVDHYRGVFAYFSAYGGRGYDPDDINFKEPRDDGSSTVALGGFQTGNAATPRNVVLRKDVIYSEGPNPYLEDSSLPIDSSGNFDPSDQRSRTYQNSKTYQIVSSGRDGIFGIGGSFYDGKPESLPFLGDANKQATGQSLPTNIRQIERDNITNFAAGKLD